MATRTELAPGEARAIDRFLGDLRRPSPEDWMTGGSQEREAAEAAGWPASTSDGAERVSVRVGRGRLVGSRFTSGRLWAYGGVLVGLVMSVGANVVAVVMPPEGAPEGWTPSEWLIWFSAGMPMLLFIAFEVLMRSRWVRQFKLARLLMGVVAALPGVVSWQHMSHLLTRLGENQVISFLGPLAIDALMVMSAMALLSEKAADRDAAEAAYQAG